jgi:Zn-dependent protease
MQNRLFDLILFYPLFLFSLSFHEAAHGLVAERYGDNTARLMGRVTLSPFPHMDILGTVILPIIGILTGAPVIGWGKPVPVNPYRLKGDIRRSSLWVAASGPISNVILAVTFALLAHGLLHMVPYLPHDWLIRGSGAASTIKMIFTILQMGVVLNLVLAFFNMLPMPPLDGGTVIRGILPESGLAHFDKFSRYSFLILLVLLVTGLLRYILIPVFYVAGLLLP